jgi:hypothetical protein
MVARGRSAAFGVDRLENGHSFHRPEIRTDRGGDSQSTHHLEQTPAGRARAEGEGEMNELEPETACSQLLWFGAALLAMTIIAYIATSFPR